MQNTETQKHEIKLLSRFIAKTTLSIKKEFICFRTVLLFLLAVTPSLYFFDTIDKETIKNGLIGFIFVFIATYPICYAFVYFTMLSYKRKIKLLQDKLYLPETYLKLSNELKEVSNELAIYPENTALQRQFSILDRKLKLMDRKIKTNNCLHI